MNPDPNANREQPSGASSFEGRDPVTGTPAHSAGETDYRSSGARSSKDIEQDIRRTRADMDETLGALEQRFTPNHIKQQVKGTVHETIDEVRDRFHPKRMARQAGRGMIDTIKENPIPSLVAGLSIGWLLYQGSSEDYDDYYYDRARRYRGRGAYGGPRYRQRGYADDPYYEGAYYDEYFDEAQQEPPYGYEEAAYRGREAYDYDEGESGGRSAREQVGHKAHEAKERASRLAEEAGHQARSAGRRVWRGAQRAESSLERMVYQNPLAAGALAVGAGALLGALLPSTETEDEWIGQTRDRVVSKAQRAAEGTMEKAQHVAERTAHEAKDAAREVKETAKSEAQRVKHTAQEGASEVKDEAKHQARQKS